MVWDFEVKVNILAQETKTPTRKLLEAFWIKAKAVDHPNKLYISIPFQALKKAILPKRQLLLYCIMFFYGSEYRAADDNETVNEVVSNWGVAQAKAAARGLDDYFDSPLEKRESASKVSNQSSEEYIKKLPLSPRTPPKPPPARIPKGLRPRDDNETINEVVSNWGAAQAMLQQRKEQPPG
uniref:CID domain-containing protein n=1 Tax=Angiostrongylus cantonensis TaxID=6313 RepID=A0A0K0CZA1_ANGCA